MNLQELRSTSNYSGFRALVGGLGLTVQVLGFMSLVAGIILVATLGWASLLIALDGLLILCVGVVGQAAGQLLADIPDLLLHLVHQNTRSSGASGGPTAVTSPAVEEPPTSNPDFSDFVDNTIDSAHDARSPQDMLASAREMLNAGQKDECKALLRELIRQHPQAPEADRARKALRGHG